MSRATARSERAREQKKKVAPELTVVDETSARPRRFSMALIGWVAAITVVAALFGMAGFHAVIVQGQQQLDDLQAQVVVQRDETDRLLLRVAELEAPERIVAEAERRLGMVPPENVEYLAPDRSGAAR